MAPQNVEELSSVVAYNELLTRCLNNVDFAERMLALFQERCAEDLSELDRAFEKNDLEALRRLAHRLAGAAANAAAFGLKAKAAELRVAATEGASERIQECLAGLRQEWMRLQNALSAERTSSPTS